MDGNQPNDQPTNVTIASSGTGTTTINDTVSGTTISPSPGQETDWEARYKGLQAANEKKKKALEEQIAALNLQIEEAKLSAQDTEGKMSTLKSEHEQLVNASKNLQADLETNALEQQKLAAEVTFQNILMSQFPDLVSFRDYLPRSGTTEEIVTRATAFRELLKAQADKTVRDTMQGATAVVRGTEDTIPTGNEEERLWKKVYETAGISGQEAEYEKAKAALMEYLSKKA